MNLAEQVFSKSTVNEERLLSFGFTLTKGFYHYERNLLSDTFRAEIVYSKESGWTGRMIDLSLEEEYLPLQIEGAHGEFHASVKEAYLSLLEEIRSSCTSVRRYRDEQAERIVSSIKKAYDVDPEWLWDKEFDEPNVFRHPDTLKWFGIMMYVPYSKFGKEIDTKVNVMNVKLKPEEISELIKIDGYEPAYHMNKKYWLSILLDDSRSDKEILSLIEKSYRITLK